MNGVCSTLEMFNVDVDEKEKRTELSLSKIKTIERIYGAMRKIDFICNSHIKDKDIKNKKMLGV